LSFDDALNAVVSESNRVNEVIGVTSKRALRLAEKLTYMYY